MKSTQLWSSFILRDCLLDNVLIFEGIEIEMDNVLMSVNSVYKYCFVCKYEVQVL